MNYEALKQTLAHYSSRDLAQRKSWYSPAALAYAQARPCYPQALIRQVVEIAQLSSESRLLEVGCGPATVTPDFAKLGCSMVCLEPNPDFYQLAQQRCEPYPNVKIQNTAFEEWAADTSQFDAVLAASSFHWIPTAVSYPKAAEVLKEDGRLILLWNKQLQPSFEVHQRLSEIYQRYAPDLNRYEDRATQEEILQGLGQIALESDYFEALQCGQVETAVTYDVDQYLTLLNTYSPYLELNPQCKEALFESLRSTIEREFDDALRLSYLSAFHVMKKR